MTHEVQSPEEGSSGRQKEGGDIANTSLAVSADVSLVEELN